MSAAHSLVARDRGAARGAREADVRDVRAGLSISIADFMVVSVIGAVLSSAVVLVLTVAVAAFCARRGLDLDNVAAPIVTAAGDMVTLPSLFLATYLLGIHLLTPIIAIACVVIGVGAAVVGIGAKALARSCGAS